MTHVLAIEYDDAVLLSAGLPEQEFNEEARFLLAGKLFEQGKLSSGQAAALCGKGRVEFLHMLPRIGISISNLRPEDAAAEVQFLTHA